jgi:hypothetical protein
VAKYQLTLSFYTDRELTQAELCDLESVCRAQIEEPVDHQGEDVTYATIIDGSEIEEKGSTYHVRTDARGALYIGRQE